MGCQSSISTGSKAVFDVRTEKPASDRLPRAPAPPTAVIAANDLVAIGAATALRQMGRRVPEDVSIIGYDNIGWRNSMSRL